MKHLRRYALLLLLALLMASCHRKADTADTAAAITTPETIAPATIHKADTMAARPDSIRTTDSHQKAIMQIDTAELTHLRIFGRKQKTFFSPRLLEGEWVLDDWHMTLDSNGHGERWNLKEGVHRNEADHFIWSMDSNLLYIEFNLSLGGIVPKMYVVTFVDNESLVYQNAYGTAYMWDRPKESRAE